VKTASLTSCLFFIFFFALLGHISQTMKLGASLPNYRTFSLEELKEATNNFDASNLLSEDSNSQVCNSECLNFCYLASAEIEPKHFLFSLFPNLAICYYYGIRCIKESSMMEVLLLLEAQKSGKRSANVPLPTILS